MPQMSVAQKVIISIRVLSFLLDSLTEHLNSFQLSFISGVLIHINPDSLSAAYDLLYNLSSKYI